MKFKRLLFGLAFAFTSCANHDIPVTAYDCTAETEKSYANEVDPIIKKSCALSGCHNGDLGDDKNWLIYDRLQEKAANVRDRITRPPGTTGHMPATGKLTYTEILTIVCWVEQGAQKN